MGEWRARASEGVVRATVILPKRPIIDQRKMKLAIENTLTAQAKAIKIDFDVTTQTWSNRPSFTIKKPSDYVREISTNDDIYAMLDAGTKPHTIRPKNSRGILRFNTPFRSKTIPNQIRSRKGSKGTTPVVARVVHHPGTAARNWAKVIQRKWQAQIGSIFQRAMISA